MNRTDHRLARAACTALAFVCLGPAGTPAGAAPAREGLQVPVGEFRLQVRAVALLPVTLPPAPEGGDRLRDRYDSLLVEQLGAAGIRGITAQAWSIARQAVIDSAGPAVDAQTGQPDPERARVIETETGRRVAGRFGEFDAMLSSSILRSDRGWTLHLEIRDPEERTLYVGSAEIARIRPLAGGGGAGASPAPLATTPERDARAVRKALLPLTKALTPPRPHRAEPPR